MDDDFFSLDTIGQKVNIDYESDTESLSSESLISQIDQENDIEEDNGETTEDLITLKYTLNGRDTDLITNLRNHIYKLLNLEPFCKSAYSNENECELILCRNGLTDKLNDMSFLLRHSCGRSYPRFLHYTKVKLSKHASQTSKRYFTNISDLTSVGECPKPIMDFTHCLSALYLLPKNMCSCCGKRDCRRTWNKNRQCDFYPCDFCGLIKNHNCRHVEAITHRMPQRYPELLPYQRDYLASSFKCIACGRIGHLNCSTNKRHKK